MADDIKIRRLGWVDHIIRMGDVPALVQIHKDKNLNFNFTCSAE
jgi:hypothetical protein